MINSFISQQQKKNKIVSFIYTLSTDSYTSAGLYSTGNQLARTLWAAKYQTAGTYSILWDGTDDFGVTLTNTDYLLKVTSNNITVVWEGVVGNNSSVSYGDGVHRGYDFITDMCITGSYIYYVTRYDEQHVTQHKASISDPTTAIQFSNAGECDAFLCCTDGVNIYWGALGVSGSLAYFFVWSTKASDDSLKTFSSGTTIVLDSSHGTYNCFAQQSNSTFPVYDISDMAVQVSGNYFFLANRHDGAVMVYNKITGAAIRSISITGILTLAISGDDSLWIGDTSNVKHYTVNGDGTLSLIQTISGLQDIKAISVNTAGTVISVCDGGTSQQVKSYLISDLSLIWTLGSAGGYASNASTSNNKFYFDFYYNFITYAPDGSFWVRDGENYRVQHYDSSRNFIDRIIFIPASYAIALDRGDNTRVFAKFLEFQIDYSKSLSPTNGSWTLVKNWKTPAVSDDYELSFVCISDVNTMGNGKTYGICYKISLNQSEIVELTTSGLRPTGIYINAAYQLYTDGIYYITLSDVNPGATAQWIKLPLTGFDGSSNPVFGSAVVEASVVRDINDPIFNGNAGNGAFGERLNGNVITYDGSAGISAIESKGYHLGGLSMSTNQFSFRTQLKTIVNYQGNFPTDERYDIGNGTNNPGSKGIVIGNYIVTGHHGEFWKGGQTNEYKLFDRQGLLLTNFGTNVKKLQGNRSSPAQMAGNAIGMHSTSSGTDLYLYHGDESFHSGVHRWKISGLDTIQEQTVSINATFPRSDEVVNAPYLTLQEGIAFDAILANNDGGWVRNPTTDVTSDRIFDWWQVKTNVKSYLFRNIDIYGLFRKLNAVAYFEKDLGTITSTTWNLKGEIDFDTYEMPPDDSYGLHVDTVDAAGKVIVRMRVVRAQPSDIAYVYVNDVLVHSEAYATYYKVLEDFTAFSITRNTFTYGSYAPLTFTPFDGTANVNQPKKFRLTFFNTSTSQTHDIAGSVRGLKISP